MTCQPGTSGQCRPQRVYDFGASPRESAQKQHRTGSGWKGHNKRRRLISNLSIKITVLLDKCHFACLKFHIERFNRSNIAIREVARFVGSHSMLSTKDIFRLLSITCFSHCCMQTCFLGIESIFQFRREFACWNPLHCAHHRNLRCQFGTNPFGKSKRLIWPNRGTNMPGVEVITGNSHVHSIKPT